MVREWLQEAVDYRWYPLCIPVDLMEEQKSKFKSCEDYGEDFIIGFDDTGMTRRNRVRRAQRRNRRNMMLEDWLEDASTFTGEARDGHLDWNMCLAESEWLKPDDYLCTTDNIDSLISMFGNGMANLFLSDVLPELDEFEDFYEPITCEMPSDGVTRYGSGPNGNGEMAPPFPGPDEFLSDANVFLHYVKIWSSGGMDWAELSFIQQADGLKPDGTPRNDTEKAEFDENNIENAEIIGWLMDMDGNGRVNAADLFTEHCFMLLPQEPGSGVREIVSTLDWEVYGEIFVPTRVRLAVDDWGNIWNIDWDEVIFSLNDLTGNDCINGDDFDLLMPYWDHEIAEQMEGEMHANVLFGGETDLVVGWITDINMDGMIDIEDLWTLGDLIMDEHLLYRNDFGGYEDEEGEFLDLEGLDGPPPFIIVLNKTNGEFVNLIDMETVGSMANLDTSDDVNGEAVYNEKDWEELTKYPRDDYSVSSGNIMVGGNIVGTVSDITLDGVDTIELADLHHLMDMIPCFPPIADLENWTFMQRGEELSLDYDGYPLFDYYECAMEKDCHYMVAIGLEDNVVRDISGMEYDWAHELVKINNLVSSNAVDPTVWDSFKSYHEDGSRYSIVYNAGDDVYELQDGSGTVMGALYDVNWDDAVDTDDYDLLVEWYLWKEIPVPPYFYDSTGIYAISNSTGMKNDTRGNLKDEDGYIDFGPCKHRGSGGDDGDDDEYSDDEYIGGEHHNEHDECMECHVLAIDNWGTIRDVGPRRVPDTRDSMVPPTDDARRYATITMGGNDVLHSNGMLDTTVICVEDEWEMCGSGFAYDIWLNGLWGIQVAANGELTIPDVSYTATIFDVNGDGVINKIDLRIVEKLIHHTGSPKVYLLDHDNSTWTYKRIDNTTAISSYEDLPLNDDG